MDSVVAAIATGVATAVVVVVIVVVVVVRGLSETGLSSSDKLGWEARSSETISSWFLVRLQLFG
jgi:hypothetical protein